MRGGQLYMAREAYRATFMELLVNTKRNLNLVKLSRKLDSIHKETPKIEKGARRVSKKNFTSELNLGWLTNHE
jgi:hypothetical protein